MTGIRIFREVQSMHKTDATFVVRSETIRQRLIEAHLIDWVSYLDLTSNLKSPLYIYIYIIEGLDIYTIVLFSSIFQFFSLADQFINVKNTNL